MCHAADSLCCPATHVVLTVRRASELAKANEYIAQATNRPYRDYSLPGFPGCVEVLNLDGSIPEEGLRIAINQSKAEAKITREIAFTDVAYLFCAKFKKS